MARTSAWIAVAALLLPLLAAVEAEGQQKRGKNRLAEDAARWLAAGDHFSLSLSGGGKILLFTTDKKRVTEGAKGPVFLVSKEEAAAFVQVLVDCGLWGRWETALPGGPIPGRILGLGNGNPQDAKLWILGDVSDDLTSMVIFQHLLKTFQGERQQAVKDWLAEGLQKGKQANQPPQQAAAAILVSRSSLSLSAAAAAELWRSSPEGFHGGRLSDDRL